MTKLEWHMFGLENNKIRENVYFGGVGKNIEPRSPGPSDFISKNPTIFLDYNFLEFRFLRNRNHQSMGSYQTK